MSPKYYPISHNSSAITSQLHSCKTLPYRKSSKKNKGYERNMPQYHHTGHRNHVIANMFT